MSAQRNDSRRGAGQRSEGKNGEEEEGKGEKKGRWCFADALGVVEILQQRASPLLSNVHLVLQVLRHQRTKKLDVERSGIRIPIKMFVPVDVMK